MSNPWRSYAATNPPLFSDLPAEKKCALMRDEFAAKSRFQRDFGSDMEEFDTADFSYHFRDEVIRLLEKNGINVPRAKLEDLHSYIPDELKRYNFDDGINNISNFLYNTDTPFLDIYHRFIKECLQEKFPYPFYFQATPTIRVHCPGGANSHHYPRYHTDINYGHPPQEINIWIPLTRPIPPQYHAFRSMDVKSSVAVMERSGFDFASFTDTAVNDAQFNTELHRFSPQIATALGRLLAFDSRCIHTAEPMISHTRVSMDIRILPKEDYEALPMTYRGMGRRKIMYVPGQAYHPHSSDQI